MKREEFEVVLTYFMPNGRLYFVHREKRPFLASAPGVLRSIHDVVGWVRGLRDHGGQGGLPGMMSDADPDCWDGAILIECAGDGWLLLPSTIASCNGSGAG